MKVFISGVKHLNNVEISCSSKPWELPYEIRVYLDRLMENGDEILIGDCGGVDERVQEYLHYAHYRNVKVYVTGSRGSTRHNLGKWEERHFSPNGQTGYSMGMEKDFRMAEDAEIGVAIWDGMYKGTYINMIYLLAQWKSCRLFHISEKRWIDIHKPEDLMPYTGEEGEIGDNEVRMIMERCRFSNEMNALSLSEQTISPYMLVDIICRASISLDQKLCLLSALSERRNIKYELYETVRDNINNNRSLKKVKHDIRACVDFRSKESIWMYIWNCYKELMQAREEKYEPVDDMENEASLYTQSNRCGGECMKKGIFWCYVSCFDDDMYTHQLLTVMVDCDLSGKALDIADFSSKSGDNFNHKTEWEKRYQKSRITRNKPYDYYPRGRVEIKNGKIRIFANPIIIGDEEARGLIIKSFGLGDFKENISWISDNSKHYRYAEDAMSYMSFED